MSMSLSQGPMPTNQGRRRAVSATISCMVLLLAAACTRHEPVPPPKIKLNPKPQQRYQIILRAEELPSIFFDKIDGNVPYGIEKNSCIPIDYTRSLGGSKPFFRERRKIKFTRISDIEYQAHVFSDLIANEDYYGLGVCEWKLGSVVAEIHARGQAYRASVGGQKIMLEGSQETFCIKPDIDLPFDDRDCVLESAVANLKYGMNSRLKITLLSRKATP